MTVGQFFDGSEFEGFRDGVAEIEAAFAEPVTILRFVSQSTTPDNFGRIPKPVYSSFPASAVLKDLGVGESALAAGAMQAGDIFLEMRDQLREADEANGGSHPGDLLVFRGARYRLVQRQIPVSIGPDAFFNTHLRRVNDPTDVGGA